MHLREALSALSETVFMLATFGPVDRVTVALECTPADESVRRPQGWSVPPSLHRKKEIV